MATRTTPPRTPELRLIGLALCFLLALLTAACQVDEQAAATNAFPMATPTPELAEAAIYAAVIRQLAGPDDTFGGKLTKSTLYIVRRTNDATRDPRSDASPPVILPDATQDTVTTLLADLPSRVVWVNDFDDVAREPDTDRVANEGVIIQVGNVRFEGEARALVPGSIYIANMAAGGATYIVEQQGSQWVVVGNTGTTWIS